MSISHDMEKRRKRLNTILIPVLTAFIPFSYLVSIVNLVEAVREAINSRWLGSALSVLAFAVTVASSVFMRRSLRKAKESPPVPECCCGGNNGRYLSPEEQDRRRKELLEYDFDS